MNHPQRRRAIEPRLLAGRASRFSRSPTISERGNSWRARTHVMALTRRTVKPRSTRSNEPLKPIRTTRREKLLGFCLMFAAHKLDRPGSRFARRSRHIVRAIALDDCDPWGQIAFGLLSMMERRTRSRSRVPAWVTSIRFGGAHCYLSHGLAFPAGSRAIAHGKGHQVEPLDRRWRCFGGIAVAHICRTFAEAVRCSRNCCDCGRISGRATHALASLARPAT